MTTEEVRYEVTVVRPAPAMDTNGYVLPTSWQLEVNALLKAIPALANFITPPELAIRLQEAGFQPSDEDYDPEMDDAPIAETLDYWLDKLAPNQAIQEFRSEHAVCHCTRGGGMAACHTHEDGQVYQYSHTEGRHGLEEEDDCARSYYDWDDDWYEEPEGSEDEDEAARFFG